MNCKVCDNGIYFGFMDSTNERLRNQQLCFDCSFWQEKVDLDQGEWKNEFVIIDGVHYHIAPDTKSGFQGFGGNTFYIKFKDRPYEEAWVVTRNLWCQGDIPEQWRKSLPDNAEFVTADQFNAYMMSRG